MAVAVGDGVAVDVGVRVGELVGVDDWAATGNEASMETRMATTAPIPNNRQNRFVQVIPERAGAACIGNVTLQSYCKAQRLSLACASPQTRTYVNLQGGTHCTTDSTALSWESSQLIASFMTGLDTRESFRRYASS